MIFYIINIITSLFEYDRKILELINQNRIKALDHFFIYVTNTATIVAVAIAIITLLYALYKKNKILKLKGWQLSCAYLFCVITVTIIKHIVNRERPFLSDKLIEKLTSEDSPSFPSGHTAKAFVIATSISLLFPKRKWVIALVWIWAILVAYSRMALGVHYPSDILGSILIGTICALIINKIFKKYRRRNEIFSIKE